MTFLSAVSLGVAILSPPAQDGAATPPLSAELGRYASARTLVVSEAGRTLGFGVIVDPKGFAILPGEVAFAETGSPRKSLKGKVIDASYALKVIAFDPSTDLALVSLPEASRNYEFAELAERLSSTIVLVILPNGPARGQVAVTGVSGVIALSGRYMPLNEIRLDSRGRAPTGAPVYLPNGKLAGLINAELQTNEPAAAVESMSMPGARALSGFAAKLGPLAPATAFSLDLPVLDRVISGFRSPSRTIEHPWIGLFFKTGAPPALGAEVTEVVAGSPGEAAGIRIGDAIIGSAQQSFRSHVEFAAFLFGKKPGENFSLAVARDDRVRTVQVRLAREPHSTDSLVRKRDR
ncbi:MAG: PDZ domain-containing protein [Armatimonadota bacterium]|nr:PDZ domain-containing protein [Armatimonadota bacterium]